MKIKHEVGVNWLIVKLSTVHSSYNDRLKMSVVFYVWYIVIFREQILWVIIVQERYII